MSWFTTSKSFCNQNKYPKDNASHMPRKALALHVNDSLHDNTPKLRGAPLTEPEHMSKQQRKPHAGLYGNEFDKWGKKCPNKSVRVSVQPQRAYGDNQCKRRHKLASTSDLNDRPKTITRQWSTIITPPVWPVLFKSKCVLLATSKALWMQILPFVKAQKYL